MGITYTLCTDLNTFRDYTGPRINYSTETFDGAIHIIPHSLLFEGDVCEQPIEVKNDAIWRKSFFMSPNSDISFDLFAASFFLLSRYEEYLPHSTDEHGRYPHEKSLAYQHDFLEMPLVDIWCEQLKQLILEHYPSITYKKHSFRFLSTIDIDFAYKYHGIGWKRHLLKLGKAFVQLRWNDALEQLLVVSGTKKDSYDTYSYIHKNIEQNHLNLQYFMLMRTGTLYDKNILPTHPAFIQLIKKLNGSYTLGLHPSYYSDKGKQLETEQSLLSSYSNKKVTQSRQHFLRMKLPDTYMHLLSLGITDDYSMIYSGASGFRASTAHSFAFFNLASNQATTLTLHPSMIMDVTLKNRHRFSPQQALTHIEKLMNEVKKVNGTCIPIWHNSSLCNDKEWGEWREVFEKLHTLASSKTRKEID